VERNRVSFKGYGDCFDVSCCRLRKALEADIIKKDVPVTSRSIWEFPWASAN